MKQDCHNYVYKKCLRVSNTFISLRIFKSPFTCFRTHRKSDERRKVTRSLLKPLWYRINNTWSMQNPHMLCCNKNLINETNCSNFSCK